MAVRREAPAAGVPERDLAARLLATVWTAGVVAGVNTEDWVGNTPELPGICVRMATLIADMAGPRTPD